MLSKHILYYGKPEPPSTSLLLRAGPLSLVYEAGGLRYIKFGDRTILLRIYVAVRDHNWRTIPFTLSDLDTDIADDWFYITFYAVHQQGDIDFRWRGTIDGNAQGRIIFIMDGVVRSTFRRNRIGICTLHPIQECAGQSCTLEKVDESVEQSVFPQWIAPQAPFSDVYAITHEVVPGVRARVRFAGDTFETEDQRNWTDASFKTYSTPQRLPKPVEVKAGTEIVQSVVLNLRSEAPMLRPLVEPTELTLTIDPMPIHALPRIGLAVASHQQPLSQLELERLKAIQLSHLRAELNLTQPDYEGKFQQAVESARLLNLPLEIALTLTQVDDLKTLTTLLEMQPTVCSWLVFDQTGKTSTTNQFESVRQILKSYNANAKVGSGTNLYFADLNLHRPAIDALELVSYSLNPQVHTFDNTSMVENLATQAVTVASARQFLGDVAIALSPITLKPRHPPQGGEFNAANLPPQVDPRQMSLFAAAWTIASLKYIAQAGIYSVTYYETTGWQGIMETAQGSPLPEQFYSFPNSVFPLYHIFADVCDLAGGDVLPTKSSDPLKLEGLALRWQNQIRVMLVNLTPEPQQARVKGLNDLVRVRWLNEQNVIDAMRSPENFRAIQGELAAPIAGTLQLDLLPYAIVRIDTTASE